MGSYSDSAFQIPRYSEKRTVRKISRHEDSLSPRMTPPSLFTSSRISLPQEPVLARDSYSPSSLLSLPCAHRRSSTQLPCHCPALAGLPAHFQGTESCWQPRLRETCQQRRTEFASTLRPSHLNP